MITSQKQYNAAKKKMDGLKSFLSQKTKKQIPPVLLNAARGQIQELCAELEQEMQDYQKIQDYHFKTMAIHSFDDLLEAPMHYRIASHLTIEDFAKLVNVHSRQIARYEASHYRNTTAATLQKIIGRLGLQLEGSVIKNG